METADRPITGAEFGCSQCGRPLPGDPSEVERWRHGPLFVTGELDDDAAQLLLCPDCVSEERAREFEEGAGG
jgi:hypothetical protein